MNLPYYVLSFRQWHVKAIHVKIVLCAQMFSISAHSGFRNIVISYCFLIVIYELFEQILLLSDFVMFNSKDFYGKKF
jgi:hypothetical protein